MDVDEKFSIKNILFTKSLTNYEIPVPVDGHKIFPCIDCGDKFMFENSYNDHLNRKSMQITYICRFCNQTKLFFNRCRLLFHIRSHAFKTATINVNDLKVEPLPLGFFATKPIHKKKSNPLVIDITKNTQNNSCFECKQKIGVTVATYKDRVDHFMQYTNEVHSCPVCLFALPTICGLRAHLRFHLNLPPFICPECGINFLPTKNVTYPYGHDCEGFKMMRATTRLKCPVPNCHFFHPNDFREHMKENHLKKVYKCPFCVVACFNEVTMNKHLLEEHKTVEPKALFYHQCELCPGRLVVQNNIDNHLRTHTNAHTFPCWACGNTFKDVCVLLDHHQQKHGTNDTIAIKNMLSSNYELEKQQENVRRVYRVVKRCDLCKRNFTYKCNFNEISVLPNECPFKCSQSQSNFKTVDSSETLLTCHLCKEKISQNWEEIKNHYAKNHKMHKCLDTKVVLKKIDVTKYNKKKTRVRNTTRKVKARKCQQLQKVKTNEHELVKTVTSDVKVPESYCTMCDYTYETKEQLEIHFLSHKDPCMAYQCMECGQSFVVKPSFSTHLVLEHGISNAEEYIINKNRCYNEVAIEKYQNSNIFFEPLKDNQCKICREQFENSEDLAKHFRGHGMAFLLKSTSNKCLS